MFWFLYTATATLDESVCQKSPFLSKYFSSSLFNAEHVLGEGHLSGSLIRSIFSLCNQHEG